MVTQQASVGAPVEPLPKRRRRIVVAVDPSALAQPVLDKAARIAQRRGAILELQVRDARQQVPASWAGSSGSDEYRAILRARTEAELQSLVRPLRARGLDIEIRYDGPQPAAG